MSRSITWFPNLRRGLPRIAPLAVEPLITAAWKVAVEIRAIAEDLEGAAKQQHVVDVLAIKLAEFLTEIDLQLGGWAPVEEDHLLPLALGFGWNEIARCDGGDVVALLGLAASQDPASARRLGEMCQDIVAAFPGELPDPLTQQGQGPILRALRNWSKLCRATDVPEDFLVPLVRDV